MLVDSCASALCAGVDTAQVSPEVPKPDIRPCCVECGEAFAVHPRGWSRRYCSDRCKETAWRRSHVDAARAKGRRWWTAHSQERNAKRRGAEYAMRRSIARARIQAEAENQKRDRRAKLANLFKPRAAMLEFSSVTEMQAHYKAVRQRVRFNKGYTPPGSLPEPATAAEPTKAPWWTPQVTEIYQPSSEPEFPVPPMVGEIVRAVANYYRLSLVDMLSDRRTKEVVLPRQVAMYLCRTLSLKSLPGIGRSLGGRDHTTVLYGFQKIREKIKTDDFLAYQVATIEGIIAR